MELQDYIKLPYSRVLIPEDVGYSGSILEFPGCFSCGETADETLMNLDDAMLAWIDAALGLRQDIPTPFILDAKHPVMTRLDIETYRELMSCRDLPESMEDCASRIVTDYLVEKSMIEKLS